MPDSIEDSVSACCGDSVTLGMLQMTEPGSGRSLLGSGKRLHTRQMDPGAV